MELARTLEPFQTLMANMPPVEKLPLYTNGLLRLLRTGVGIQLDAVFHRKAIEEQGHAFFDGVERDFFEEMSKEVLDKSGWEMELSGELPNEPGGRWIYMMNHPTLLATWTPLHVASRYIAPNTAVIAKSEIIENPLTAFLIGKPLKCIGKVGFIKRDEREEAYLGVQKAVEQVLRPNTGLVIFPDSSRPYPSKLKKEQDAWDAKLPDLKVKDWLTETCFPRSGGLWNLLRATEDMPDVRVMDFTVAEPKRRGGQFHVKVQERSREEMLGKEPSVECLKDWLIENWKEKNRVIRDWRA